MSDAFDLLKGLITDRVRHLLVADIQFIRGRHILRIDRIRNIERPHLPECLRGQPDRKILLHAPQLAVGPLRDDTVFDKGVERVQRLGRNTHGLLCGHGSADLLLRKN